MKIRIVLADDHPALLAGVLHELSAVPALSIVGTAKDSGELVAVLETTACDVLVTDYAMPGGAYGDGLIFLGYLRRAWPELKIIVFTTIENPAIVKEVAKLGVQSVMSKSHPTRDLISAIHAVEAGAMYFPAGFRTVASSSHNGLMNERTQTLSTREMEVVRLFVSGMSVNEIAEQLRRSKQTISSQKTRAMRKIGVDRDADLFRYAYEVGISEATNIPGPKN